MNFQRKIIFWIFTLLFLIFWSPKIYASISFEFFFLGDALNFPTPLTIILNDEKPIYTTAIYETRAEKIQYFNISHGYNLITLNKAWRDKNKEWLIYRIGLGIVLAHPQSKINGEEWTFVEGTLHGFFLASPTFQFSIGTRHFLGRFFISSEAKLTLSYAIASVIVGKVIDFERKK